MSAATETKPVSSFTAPNQLTAPHQPGPLEPAPDRWAFRLGRLFGIQIYAHATFVVLLVWIALGGLARGVAAAGRGVALVLAAFSIIVLHELGHALVARRFGVKTRDITLLPIGGVARLDRIPDKPTHELLVSFAGPAVNVALALTLWGLAWLIGLPLRPVGSGALSAPFLVQLFWLNVSLAIFNLLPAFPMDGGRVLRAALALKIDYVRATRLAAWLGQAMALAFAAFGLSHQPMLLLIAVFVWLGARREAARVELRRAASQARVANAMVTHFHVLSPNDRLGVAAELLVSGSVHGFPVLQGGELVGVLSREDVVRGIARLGASAPVRDAMNRKVAVARPADPLDTALARLESDATPIVVVQDHATVGMVTAEAIAEFMLRLRSELSATTDTESQMR